jgi:archaellum component FlaC
MSDQGIIKPLRDRVRDLEQINNAHQKKNGQLRVEIQEKNKQIEELIERINNPLNKLRGQGDL